MRAYVMEGPGRGGIKDVPDPVLGDLDARVEMVVCGICSSTDKMLRAGTFRGGVTYPSILGHEAVGRVVELGPAVRHIPLGSLVTRPSAYQPDRAPLGLYWGGFAEQGVVTDWEALREDRPDREWRPRFDQMRFEPERDPASIALAISLSETFSVICRTDVLNRTVAVAGTGIAGLSFVAYARLLGAATVVCVGRRRSRLELAERLGADSTAVADGDAPESLMEAVGRADIVFEASGQADMVGRSCRWLKPGGREVIYSAPEAEASIDLMAAPRDASIIVASTHETSVMPGVVRMVEGGVIDRDLLLTHRYAFAEIKKAFDEVAQGGVVKGLVTFT
ncbi:MAG TPA: zinc-binding dehydrogenase [Candidatus Dormibacteraeota bacterium]|jgi:2-desacetyl-2-hydroxyethyl bacteriochlorophyllide A dehydrogenase|nr:zinc-binding dehydrogenase [Candidatus Dormibacteraeota bacterium]